MREREWHSWSLKREGKKPKKTPNQWDWPENTVLSYERELILFPVCCWFWEQLVLEEEAVSQQWLTGSQEQQGERVWAEPGAAVRAGTPRLWAGCSLLFSLCKRPKKWAFWKGKTKTREPGEQRQYLEGQKGSVKKSEGTPQVIW